jgi:hypothetical protein
MSKVSVTYNAPEGDEAVVTMRGVRFFDGQALHLDPIEHDGLIAKLRNNQHFEVEGGEPKAPKAEKKPKATVEGLRAVHIAGGRFKIVDGLVTIKEGLNKADADAFNAMSPEDRAAYVAE